MTVSIPTTIEQADGLEPAHRAIVHELVQTWQAHLSGNLAKNTYYQGRAQLKDLGISVPDSLKKLEVSCDWGYKVVEVMADHISFDGFSAADDATDELLRAISRRNSLRLRVSKAVNSALKYCFTMWVVTATDDGHARISAYPPTLATGIWNDVDERLDAGMYVVSFERKNGRRTDDPDWVDVMLPDCLIRLKRHGERWSAEYLDNGLGVVSMFVMPYNPDDDRPFGESRITREVMWNIDCAIRAEVNEEIASAFAASTQKYLLGTDGESFEDVSKWEAYIGSILEVEMNSDGGTPQFGQLTQPSMQPLTDHFRNICARMSACTGIHVSQFGVVTDNPSSAEAIYAENEPLVKKCEGFIEQAKVALGKVCLAALATENGQSYGEAEEAYEVSVMFANPSSPQMAQRTDASIKVSSVAPFFAETKEFWRMNGYDDESAELIQRQMAKAKASQLAQQAAMNAAATRAVSADAGDAGDAR